MTAPVTWVIGASGLLGRHTHHLAAARGHTVLRAAVPWDDDVQVVVDALCSGAERMLSTAGSGRWNVVWVAGAGVIGTPAEVLRQEGAVFSGFLTGLADLLLRGGSCDGSLFLASSAGGVYAGADDPPFTESTQVAPLAPYGENKLVMEAAATDFVDRTGLPVTIGRISNLYGPGQDLAKPQGLISALARAHLLRTPVPIYVSLDTMRDYLYVGDCARVVVRAVELVRADVRHLRPTVKILASGRSTTVAELLGVFARVSRRRPPVVLGDSPSRKFQVRDLRLRSMVWTDLDRLVTTTLPVGIDATIKDIGSRVRAGELAAHRSH